MRLTALAGTAAGALLFATPVLADSQMTPEAQPGKTTLAETVMSARCDRLAERFVEAEIENGESTDVLEAEVLHERGTRACEAGNYDRGIELIQEALRDIGAPDEVEAN